MKTTVLLVEESIKLDAFENMLAVFGEEYKFLFAKNASQAISLNTQNKIDVILTEMDLPGINGIDLLKIFKNNYPQIIRIISGECKNRSCLTEALTVAHQMIPKPLELEKLKKSLSRIKLLQKYLLDENLTKVINSISDLPTLPQTYIDLEKELSAENISMNKIRGIVVNDLSFTAKVLQIVNSPFFGIANKIRDPMQAVNFLGMNVLRSLMLFHNLYNGFRVSPKVVKYYEKMWVHSNKVGRFAEELIYMSKNKEIEMMEDAYIAGLLHDIGKVVMLSLHDYPENIFDMTKEKNIRYSQAEYSIYGTSHSEVGAYFLTLWELPESIVNAVYSHKRNSGIDFSNFTVPNAVYIANQLTDDEDMTLQTIKSLKLGPFPQNWLDYLEEKNNPKTKNPESENSN
ncbi:MAG: HDOD domain-containing protein [Bacteroidetes bacterium]|nr:HDOD domain-containing protein [Bacteroidota bacterium]